MSTKPGGWMGEDTGKKKKGGEIGRDEKKLVSYQTVDVFTISNGCTLFL